MNIDEVVQQLTSHRDKLDAAIQALEGNGTYAAITKGHVHPTHVVTTRKVVRTFAKVFAHRAKRTLSPAARRRISLAQKKRWAKLHRKAR